jgi:TIR domain-containing protein
VKYDAFISYSHAIDEKLPGYLQSVLSRLGKPWYRPRGLRIFRDKTTLSATPHLWPAIAQALDHADYFILMASPAAAESRWVKQEIEHWLSREPSGQGMSPVDRMLIVLTDGTIVWDDQAGDFDWQRTNGLPPGLRRVFQTEPLYVDLTWAHTAKDLTVRDPRLLESVAKLAGAIRGLPPDEIMGEEVRQHRKMRLSAGIAAAVLLLAAVAAGFFWWQGRDIREQKKLQDTAERVLPQRAGELDRIRTKEIGEIRIALSPEPLTRGGRKILELRLELNPLFTQPMSIYFAPFHEGDTWPEGFEFTEPAYTQFGMGQGRVDAKFRWFDRIEDLSQSIDGTDVADSLADFTLEFDGKEFMPGSPGIHLPQKFEIPPLQKLLDDRDSFRLIIHDPATRTARDVDLKTSDIDLTVTAAYRDEGNAFCVLFASRHTPEERAILEGDYLHSKASLEAEALLHRYPPVREAAARRREEQTRAARELFESGKVQSDQDRRTVARLAYQRASLAALRGQHLDALNGYLKVLELLQPLVFDREPSYEDGETIYHAARQPVLYFLMTRNYRRASDYAGNPLTIADRMIESDSAEPNYRRWRSKALLEKAQVSAGLKETTHAAEELAASIQELGRVYREHSNPASQQDYDEALKHGIEYASTWGVTSAVPVAEWRGELAQRGLAKGPR